MDRRHLLAMKKLYSSLRARLLALVFLTITPAVGLATYHWLENRREQNVMAGKQAALLLGNITREQYRLIERTRAITEQLAQIPEVKAGEPVKCSETLAEWSKRYSRFANFGVVNLDGTIFCSAVPLDEMVNEADRRWFDNTVRTQVFSTGNYHVGPITGLPVLVFGQPVFDSSGQLRFVMFAAVDLRWIRKYWREEQFPAGSIFIVMERTGAMLARYPDPEKWARKIFGENDPLYKAIISQNGEGTFETTAPDGVSRLFSVTKLGGEYLSGETFAAIGIPRSALFAAADKKLMIDATTVLAALVLLLFLGWYGSSRLVLRQVRALLDTTNRLAGGDLAARTGIRENVGELNQLAHSFDRMAEQLEEHRHHLLRFQENLRQSEDRLRRILSALPIPAFTCDAEGKITFHNESASQLWGGAAKLDDPGAHSTVPPQPAPTGDIPILRHFIAQALTEKRDVIGREIVVERPGGEERTVLAHANLLWNAAGAVTGVVCALVDITERIKAEHALRDSEGRLKLALAASRMGVWEWNMATGDNYWSPEARDIVGLDGTRATPRPFEDLLHPEDRADVAAAIEKALAEKSIYSAEFRITRPDGETVWVSSLGRAEYDDTGIAVRMIGIVQDITRRRRLMDQVRERAEQLAEVDRRKDEFLALLAHELRNPLAPIMNAVEILRMNGSSGTEHDWIVGVIERQIRHLTRLVDDLLDVSRITRGKLELRRERMDLCQAVKTAVEVNRGLMESSQLELHVMLPSTALIIDGDMIRMVQVFSNLLTNSMKFTDPGGSVAVNARLEKNEIVATVRDNGIGIPPERLDEIFEMFVQIDHAPERSQNGLGIGLTLVKQIVEMHGGSLAARSEGPGRGSEFIVRLPIAADGQFSDATAGKNITPPFGCTASLRTLVVDDKKELADTLAMVLRMMGHQVITANAAEEALTAAQQFQPEVILLDLGLPRISGYEVCRRLREQPGGEKLIIIALTGWGRSEDRLRTQEAGFDRHLVKPVTHADLKALINDTLQTRLAQ